MGFRITSYCRTFAVSKMKRVPLCDIRFFVTARKVAVSKMKRVPLCDIRFFVTARKVAVSKMIQKTSKIW